MKNSSQETLPSCREVTHKSIPTNSIISICQMINLMANRWWIPAITSYQNTGDCPKILTEPATSAALLESPTYRGRWSRSPRIRVCRCSCVPWQCWCRLRSHHSYAGRCHTHRALRGGGKKNEEDYRELFSVVTWHLKTKWNNRVATVAEWWEIGVGSS